MYFTISVVTQFQLWLLVVVKEIFNLFYLFTIILPLIHTFFKPDHKNIKIQNSLLN